MTGRRNRVRSFKASERWKKQFQKHRERHRQIRESAGDILKSSNFRRTREHIQHGNMTVNSHCINVASCSLRISQFFRIKCSRRELIRGALLHDYFLYDWHDKKHIGLHNLHGFYHPGRALQNASREYALTGREKDIIKKHMWPLTVTPPVCREAWIVTLADKWCSILETIHVSKGHGAVIEKLRDDPTREME